MNKKNILFTTAFLISALVLGTSLYFACDNKTSEVVAYNTSSLPTTIDLNDCDEQQVRNYYSSLNSLSSSERQGTNLLKNLKPILKSNQKYLSYDSGNNIWDVYCIVDRDWNKSPASSLPAAAGTYNSSTNKITNYKWGGNSATYENPYLHALYYNRENEPVAQAYGDHGNGVNNPTGINREHIWPKGAGFDTSGSGGARGDIMHLWAAHGHTNNKHSNYYYGYVDKTKSYKDEKTDTPECAGNLLGYSKTLGGTTNVFEPQDSDKGDIARACFYMVARYNNLAGNDNSIDTNNPNLELVNNLSSFQSSGYTSTSSSTGKLGILQDLLDWNRLDPPDEFEIHRNNLCYNNFTNNRNPFIDFPSWADAIWGTVDSNGNYNPTISKSASPSNDPINTGSATNQFVISNDELELIVGETSEISANNADGNISWTVEDSSIIRLNKTSSVNEEVVTITALKSGSTTITATNGTNSLTCTVTVTKPLNYGTLDNPLSVDEAIELISVTGSSATAEQMYVKGIVTSNSAYNTSYKNYDYIWLKNDDSSVSQALQLFRITASDDIKNTYGTANSMVDKEVVAHGYGMYYNNTTYELTKSNNISPSIISVEEQSAPSVEDYLNKATSMAGLRATETTNSSIETNSIVFGDLNLSNGVQYLDPFDGDNFTVTFTGGDNDGKYYTTGSGIRIYGGGSVTIASKEGNISEIVLAFDGSNKPTSNQVVNTGTYNSSTFTWTGNAESVTFTRPSGSGHWRLQSVSATSGSEIISISEVKLDFGFDITVSDWEVINNKWEVTDYGVMLFKTSKTSFDSLTPVQDAFDAGYTPAIIHEGTAELELGGEGYYSYRGTVNISSVANYGKTFCAAPFIYADGQYHFFTEKQESVYSLAEYFTSHSGCELSYNALLTILANQGE